jgi:hypothetical protein
MPAPALRPTILVALLLAALAPLAAPAVAHADAVTELVRSVATAPAPTHAARRPKHKTARHRAAGKARVRRPAPAIHRGRRSRPGTGLTAAQRGSGRVDTLDASGPVSVGDGPAIEAKGDLSVDRRLRR